MEKKNRKPLVFIALLFSVFLIVGGTIAYYTSSDTFNNEFNAGEYVVEVEETFKSPDNWTPGTTTPKEVIATNRSDTLVAVRVKLTPGWVASDGVTTLPLTDGTNEAAIINYAIDKDYKWMKDGDWYYYVRPLDKDESTSSLLESITFNPNVNISATHNCVEDQTTHSKTCTTETGGYSDATYTLKVDIETCQFDKYHEIWDAPDYIFQAYSFPGRLMANSNTNQTFGKNISRDSFESVATLSVIDISKNPIEFWDCSEDQNFAVICWYTDVDHDSKYELFIGQEGGVVANPDTSNAFAYFRNAEKVSLLDVDATQVNYMNSTFVYTGYNVTNFKLDASNWDVSGVGSLSNLFTALAYNSKNIDVKIQNWKLNENANAYRLFSSIGFEAENIKFDLTGWDFSQVNSMEGVFYDFASYCRGSKCPEVELILNGWNTTGVKNMKEAFNHSFYYVKNIDLDLSGWDTSSVTDMSQMFQYFGNSSKGTLRINFTGWDTSKVTNMFLMFDSLGSYIGEYDHAGSKITLVGLDNWNVSSVTNMRSMFNSMGRYTETINIGNLSNWNTSNVTNMSNMFNNMGYYSNKIDIGSLKIYATNIENICQFAPSLNGTFNIYSNPTSYNYAFRETSTLTGTMMTVNYSSNTTNIDPIIATKSNNSNVVKGSLLG